MARLALLSSTSGLPVIERWTMQITTVAERRLPTNADRGCLPVDPALAWPPVLPTTACGRHLQPFVLLPASRELARAGPDTVLDGEHSEHLLPGRTLLLRCAQAVH